MIYHISIYLPLYPLTHQSVCLDNFKVSNSYARFYNWETETKTVDVTCPRSTPPEELMELAFNAGSLTPQITLFSHQAALILVERERKTHSRSVSGRAMTGTRSSDSQAPEISITLTDSLSLVKAVFPSL